MTHHHHEVEIDEVRTLLRYAAQELTDLQRYAIEAYMFGDGELASASAIGVSRQALYQARRLGLQKMRRRLQELKIRSSKDLMSREVPQFRPRS